MFSKKKRRLDSAINAGSMADIAFLLLIFFLVTTTILSDEGLMVKLPPYEIDNPPQDLADRNVLTVKLNAANQLLVEGELMQIPELKGFAKNFIMNPLRLSNMAKSPQNAVVSMQCDRSTNYESYLGAYNEIKAAYREMRDEYALKEYGVVYEMLTNELKRSVAKQIPVVISEADPFDAEAVAGR